MAFSTAVPLILIPIIQPGPGEDAATFRLVMMGFGITMGAIIFFSTFFYKEKHFQQDEKQPGFIKSFIECFKNRSFIIFEVLSFTVIYAQTGLMQGVLYYFDEIEVSATPIYLSLLGGIILGVFVWVKRRDVWGVKRCLQIWLMAFAIGCLLMLLGGRWLPPAMAGFFLVGIGFSGGMYLIPIMNGDVVDMDEHRTGLRREGMYAGINSFITKPAIS
jgi:glycoside/pentoside/hexuronide:cation symporter, GPH family